VPVEVHHHEVATAGQCEIGTVFNTLVKRADWTQILKYVVHNVAHQYGKTATFMPKPIVGDNGSGMHVHQSIWKDGKNLFAGDGYAGLSEFALYYIGGIIKHAKALNAITNPGTNSYKRLVPHYEAPVKLAYSAKNRSASIRIPHVASTKARRIEDPLPGSDRQPVPVLRRADDGRSGRYPEQDPPGRSGRQEPLRPAAGRDAKIPTVCASLEEALAALDKDREFLTRGGVFSNDWIDAYIDLKMEEVNKVPHDHPPGRIRPVLQLLAGGFTRFAGTHGALSIASRSTSATIQATERAGNLR
jgi:glutamine synthetase